MRKQATAWFNGWKITLRCTEFQFRDGRTRFASTATLQHSPAKSDGASSPPAGTLQYSRVHTEEAFCTCAEAERDALARARRAISTMNEAADKPAHVLPVESDESLGARFEVTFDGRRYAFRQYRYDHFRDALRYAEAEHAKTGFLRDAAFCPSWRALFRPTAVDEQTMQRLGIAYANGRYRYCGYQYDRLGDAVAYAIRNAE